MIRKLLFFSLQRKGVPVGRPYHFTFFSFSISLAFFFFLSAFTAMNVVIGQRKQQINNTIHVDVVIVFSSIIRVSFDDLIITSQALIYLFWS